MGSPNILLVVTDTQGARYLGPYGRPELRTPAVARLAEKGVRFERAYTTSPLCTPARSALFSGIYSHTNGAWTNSLALGANVKTLGHRFQALGYRTAYMGKWHLDGHDYFGAGECPEGWMPERWYDGRNYLDELSPEQVLLWRRGLGSIELLRKHHITAEFTWAHRMTERALDFLRAEHDQPYLLVVSYDEPHHPHTCPPEYAEEFVDFEYDNGPSAMDSLESKPPHQREWAKAVALKEPQRRYKNPLFFGCNSFVDHEIGRLLAAVESAPDTYVVYTSDHGYMFGAHRLFGKGPVMYEEITRIPIIMVGPGLPAGRIVQDCVSHVDLMPTLLELVGEQAPPALEGASLLPCIKNPAEDWARRAVAIEFNRYELSHDSWGGFQPIRCLVQGNYKLVINLLSSDELYDLASDPAELTNLIADPRYFEIRDGLHARLVDWMYEKRDPFRGAAWERRPWFEKRTVGWTGLYRPNPADGFAPDFRDYDSGRKTVGVHKEFG